MNAAGAPPRFYALDALRRADGRLTIFDVQGSVGGGMSDFGAAYGRREARERTWRYLQPLAELAAGGLLLFLFDPYATACTAPRDFHRLVRECRQYAPQTSWVADLAEFRRRHSGRRGLDLTAAAQTMEWLARRHRLDCAYCDHLEVVEQAGELRLLATNYRTRYGRVGESRYLRPDEVGALAYSGLSERFPHGLRGRSWFPVVNPPPTDRFFESKWLLPALVEGTPASECLPREIPVGMGLRTAAETRAFVDELSPRPGFPRCVVKPNHLAESIGIHFLELEAAYALAAAQPAERLPRRRAEALWRPLIAHEYDEVLEYNGKQLDALLHAPNARVEPGAGGEFRYLAPYPFLESTVGLLQEFVDGEPFPSRRTGKRHKGYLRVMFFDGQLIGALRRLLTAPDDGRWRDLTAPEVETFLEPAEPAEEERLQVDLERFFSVVEERFAARCASSEDLEAFAREWALSQAAPDEVSESAS